jgi:hypothetical protein
MLLIYSTEITPRLEYIARLVFTDILGLEITFTSDSVIFNSTEQPKLNYSTNRFHNEPFLKSGGLLFSASIEMPKVEPVYFGEVTGFFKTSDDSLLPFDPLSSSFLLVSRLEEYIPGPRDRHHRFKARFSLQYRYDLLEKPMVNVWSRMLGQKLTEIYPDLEIRKPEFTFLSTIDIDNAWAYRNKGWIRTLSALAKELFKGSFRRFKRRLAVLTGQRPDPYDTYDYLFSELDGLSGNIIFFLHVGDYGRHDRPVSWKNTEYRKIVREISRKFRIGIHPSYFSSRSEDHKRILHEISRLESITGKKIETSRQHYLRLSFPKTYQRLIEAGIREDHSMGFADMAGFRAGTCTPFYFFDLTTGHETSLRIIPFQIMDVTLKQYMKLSPVDAREKIATLMNAVREVGGVFTGIWHNESVSNKGEWKGYRETFEFMNRIGSRNT